MEPIFTIPYPEFEVIKIFKRKFKSKNDYDCFIPVGRQQKGCDLIILNRKKDKVLKIQVKSSTWHKHSRYIGGFWYPNFEGKYKLGDADLYILHGIYAYYQKRKGKKVNNKKIWKSFMLCFNEKEMFDFLKKAKTINEKKRDTSLGFTMINPRKVIVDRGMMKGDDVSHRLFERYCRKINF